MIAALATEGLGYPAFLVKARKFGAKDCSFCHVDPMGGAPWNERGQWLIHEKQRRKADVIDVEWLAEYKSDKAEEKEGSTPSTSSGEVESGTGAVEKELAATLDELATATRQQDGKIIDRILADDFSETSADGLVFTKPELLAALPDFKAEKFQYSDVKTRVFADTAITTLRETGKATFRGQDASGEYRLTYVWLKRDGRWQIVAAHASRIPSGQK